MCRSERLNDYFASHSMTHSCYLTYSRLQFGNYLIISDIKFYGSLVVQIRRSLRRSSLNSSPKSSPKWHFGNDFGDEFSDFRSDLRIFTTKLRYQIHLHCSIHLFLLHVLAKNSSTKADRVLFPTRDGFI